MSNIGTSTMPTHLMWSCHVTQDANFESFFFCPNSTFKISKSHKISSGKRLRTTQNDMCLSLFGLDFFPTLKDRGSGKMAHCHNSYISSPLKNWCSVVILFLWRHCRFYVLDTWTSNFSNFHRIKLKFDLNVDFAALISNFN